MEYIESTKLRLTTEFQTELIQERAELYASCVFKKGAPLPNCAGFIDGTALQIARQIRGQEAVYSGHKRLHFLNFQIITIPDGLIFHFFGPIEGRRDDMTIYRNSGVEQILSSSLNVSTAAGNTQYCVYGDPAYVIKPWLQVGYKGANLTPTEHLYTVIRR